MVLAGAALPLGVRVGIATLIAAHGAAALRSVILLRGAAAVVAIEWTPADRPGTVCLQVGRDRRRIPGTFDGRSFRFGRSCLFLIFSTPEGTRRVLLDAGVLEVRAFRRLCRAYSRVSRGD
jgi:hypothetical protein